MPIPMKESENKWSTQVYPDCKTASEIIITAASVKEEKRMDYQSKIIGLVGSMDEDDPTLEKLYHTVKKMCRNRRPSSRCDIAPPERNYR